jgi:BASS family bile acid:Na+ symporter
MTLETIVRLGLLASIWLMVLSLGARTPPSAVLFMLRRPGKLARALAAMFVVVPAFAVLLAATLPLPAAIRFALVAMSVGPVPPILPYKQMKAGGDEAYAMGLLVAAAVASMLLTPPLIALAARLLSASAVVDGMQIARTLLLTIGLPLAAGLGLRVASEPVAHGVSQVAQRVGSLLLLAVFAAMVASAWREILGLFGNGAALAIAATVAVGLLAGHLLAGPRHRAALALAAASRHPGVALAIAAASYPDQRKAISAAILLYLLVTALVTAPYVRWASGRAAALEPPGTAVGGPA